MELSSLEYSILVYAKQTDFHGTLKQFLECNPDVEESVALETLRGMKRKHLVSMPPDLMNGWIGITNLGHRRID